MVPVEASACGTPVIAYGHGGATETVVPPEQSDEPTGLWFPDPTPASLDAAMKRLESSPGLVRAETCARQAGRFRKEVFFDGMRALLDRNLQCQAHVTARGMPIILNRVIGT